MAQIAEHVKVKHKVPVTTETIANFVKNKIRRT